MVFLEFQSKLTKFWEYSWNSSQPDRAFIAGFPVSSIGGEDVDIFWNNLIDFMFLFCYSVIFWHRVVIMVIGTLSKIEVHSAMYHLRILNSWTTKPCFEIVHGLLVPVLDEASKNETFQISGTIVVVSSANCCFLEMQKLCKTSAKSHILQSVY